MKLQAGLRRIKESPRGSTSAAGYPQINTPKTTSKSDLEKGRLLSSKGLLSGPPRRPQNHQNPSPEASQKASWKKSRKSVEKVSKSDPLDLPKPGEGSQKSHFSGFRKRFPNGPPKASLLEAFWAPKSAKSRSGRVPEKTSKIGAPNDRSRVQKGPKNGWHFRAGNGYFFRSASREAPRCLQGTILDPFWYLFGWFFDNLPYFAPLCEPAFASGRLGKSSAKKSARAAFPQGTPLRELAIAALPLLQAHSLVPMPKNGESSVLFS